MLCLRLLSCWQCSMILGSDQILCPFPFTAYVPIYPIPLSCPFFFFKDFLIEVRRRKFLVSWRDIIYLWLGQSCCRLVPLAMRTPMYCSNNLAQSSPSTLSSTSCNKHSSLASLHWGQKHLASHIFGPGLRTCDPGSKYFLNTIRDRGVILDFWSCISLFSLQCWT